jgi:hypothetical protein
VEVEDQSCQLPLVSVSSGMEIHKFPDWLVYSLPWSTLHLAYSRQLSSEDGLNPGKSGIDIGDRTVFRGHF